MSGSDRPFLTVDTERRGYGRRYTSLPVDELRRDGFAIDFTGAYTRPEQIDIRPGDVVRWREGGRLVQGKVAAVQLDGQVLRVAVEGARPLPPDAFYP
ncbi:MAG TPA: hypothetical protein VNL77_18840 [Roseiflexaceae bacterium]|nr:hypothetical protein [Roseiflexaceae bacterium]